MFAFFSIIILLNYIVKAQDIARTTDDILCASGSEHDLVDGRYKYLEYNSEFNATVYYDANTTQYLYPFVDTNFYAYLIHTESTDSLAHSFCLVNTELDTNYIFNIDDCYTNWQWVTGDVTTPLKDDLNLRVMNCNNICITNNDIISLNGIYIWSHINITSNSSIYHCKQCMFGHGAYLYGWIHTTDSADWFWWLLGPSYHGIAWSFCILGTDLGPNYLFKLKNCVEWGTHNGSVFVSDPDVETNKCVLPETTTNKPLTTSIQTTTTTQPTITTTVQSTTTSIQATTTNTSPSPTSVKTTSIPQSSDISTTITSDITDSTSRDGTVSTPTPIQILNITSGLRVKHESCHILSRIYYMSSGTWNDRGFCDDKYECNEIDDSKYQMVDENNPLIIDIYSMPSINITVEGTMDHPNIKCLKYRYNESEVIINNKMYQFNFECGCETVDNSYIMCYDCARYLCSDNQPLICYDSNITPSTTDNKPTQKPLPSRTITDDDCSYIDFSGPVPTDVCYFKYKSNADERSSMFECTNDGRIILNKYFNDDCSGNAEVSEDYSFKGYNYYCLGKICHDTIKVIRDCMNNGEYWEILRVNNICLNKSKIVCAHNNIFMFKFDNEECDGFPIASEDWENIQDDTICDIRSQCMATMEGGEGTTESDNDREKGWKISDTIIIVIVVIVVIILIVVIIFIVYYYKTKKTTDSGSNEKQKESKMVNDKANTNKISYAPIPTETVTETEMTETETLVQNQKQ